LTTDVYSFDEVSLPEFGNDGEIGGIHLSKELGGKMKARRALSIIAVVLLLTINFGARPMSDTAYASDKGGAITVTGTLVSVEGVECPHMIFLGSFNLFGNLEGFGPGDLVTVTGAQDILSTCQQGIPLRVISIR
jgi:hypothetical protein